MKLHSIPLAGIIVLLALSACKEEPLAPSLNIPDSYTGENFLTDAAEEILLRSNLNTLVAEIKVGRVDTLKLLSDNLQDGFSMGTPNLKEKTTAYYQNLLTETNGWFDEIAKASGNKYVPGTSSVNGGVFGGYLFDEHGLELEQMIEKGLFGAMSYYQAQELLSTPTTANLNRALYLYGAHPSFPNTPTASKTSYPDMHMANYAARRSDINHAKSLYNLIRDNFIIAQAAITRGSAFNRERDAAILEIKQNWEKVNAATIINYCHSVISTMSNTDPTDAQKASALHAYGECVGFMHGWRQLPANSKIISDAEIDEVLTLLLAAPGQTPESYKFITEPAIQLPRLQQVIEKLQSIYGFSNAEIDSFKNNWVNVQNR